MMSPPKLLNNASLRKISFFLAMIAIAFSLAAFSLASIMAERYAAARQEELQAENRGLALTAAENVQQMLSKVDMILLFAQMELARHNRIPEEHAPLFQAFCQLPFIDNIAVFDAAGNLHYSVLPMPANLNIADNKHFQATAATNGQSLYIGSDWQSLSTDKPAFFLGRRLIDSQGNFAGIAAIALDRSYLDSVIRSLELEHQSIFLLHRNGGILGSVPPVKDPELLDGYFRTHPLFENYIDQGTLSESFEADSPLDKERYLIAFHVLTNYPLIIMTADRKNDVMTPALLKQQEYMLWASSFSLLLIISTLIIWWQIRRQIAITLELKEHHDQLEYLSYHDQLTGLFNRHYLEKFIEGELARSDRYNEHYSMLLLDLDHFKKINDTFGHPIGDQVLRLTADILRQRTRKADMVARLGGEEFTVLMPNTPMNGAMIAAEKIRAVLESSPHPVAGKITVSVGVAERLAKESFVQWYRRVDAALYRAKASGRNCIVNADEQCPLPFASIQLTWQPEWSCGHPAIDSQHQNLIELGNKIIQKSFVPSTTDNLLPPLENLIDHLIYHFATEEHLLREAGYEHTDSHAAIHKELIAKALRLKNDYQAGKLKSAKFFAFIVDDILVGHILEEDSMFFPCLQAKQPQNK